jgi:hypothetical protein
MTLLAEVTLRAMPYTDAVAQDLAKLPFDAPHAWHDWLTREIKSGGAQLCAIESAGQQVGLFAYRIDQQQKKELRVLGAYAANSSNLAPRLFDAAFSLAKRLDCASVSFSTLRPGLLTLALQHGYRVAEVFLIRPVT